MAGWLAVALSLALLLALPEIAQADFGFLTRFGEFGTGNGQFKALGGIAALPSGDMVARQACGSI